MKRLLSLVALSLTVGSMAGTAHASVFRDWLHGAERHDGLYLRAHAGLGFGMLMTGHEVDMNGLALALSAEVGGMVGPEAGLHLALWSSTLVDPGVGNFFEGTVRGDASSTLVGVGPGMILYFGSSGLWFSGNVAAVIGDVDSPVIEDVFGRKQSKSSGAVGFGTQFAAGMAFWVGDETQLGISTPIGFATVPLEGGGGVYFTAALAAQLTFD